MVAAGDDSGNLSAFRLPGNVPAPPPQQNATVLYKHPKTVWAVAALPHGAGGAVAGLAAGGLADVATGSADHAVRVFTADSGRALQGDKLREVEEASAPVGCDMFPWGFCAAESIRWNSTAPRKRDA